jgi:glycosyltransferase involved in cell wall biosynthesis
MKLLLLISELGYGGAEGALIRLGRALGDRHQIHIAVFQEHYATGNYERTTASSNTEVRRLDKQNQKPRALRWFNRAKALRKLREELSIDATISFLTGPNILNALTTGRGLKIASARATRLYEAGSSRLSKLVHATLLDPIVLRRVDAVVTVSKGLSLELSGGDVRLAPKIVTISGYVDSERVLATSKAPIEPELDHLSEKPVIMAIGRQSCAKGFSHLLRVFTKLKAIRPDVVLVLVGDGPLHGRLQEQCASLGLRHDTDVNPARNSDVFFLGYREDPNRYLQLARVFAFTSLSEGLPNVLLEAFASRARIVAADIPWGVRDVFELPPDPRPYPLKEPLYTDYGVLMPPLHIACYDDHWISTLSDQLNRPPPSAEEMAKRHQRVRTFDVRLAADRWSELLERLIAEK